MFHTRSLVRADYTEKSKLASKKSFCTFLISNYWSVVDRPTLKLVLPTILVIVLRDIFSWDTSENANGMCNNTRPSHSASHALLWQYCPEATRLCLYRSAFHKDKWTYNQEIVAYHTGSVENSNLRLEVGQQNNHRPMFLTYPRTRFSQRCHSPTQDQPLPLRL